MDKAIVRITNIVSGIIIDKNGQAHYNLIPISQSKSNELFEAIKAKRKHVKSISRSHDFLDYHEITLFEYTSNSRGFEETYIAELNTDLTKLIFGNDEDISDKIQT